MPLNTDNIRTTHAGSLPRTPELLAANAARETEGITPRFLEFLEESVVDVVARWNYSVSRLGGLAAGDKDRWADTEVRRSSPGNAVLTSFPDRRDRALFRDDYSDPDGGVLSARKPVIQPRWSPR